jgi:hypothetical protein
MLSNPLTPSPVLLIGITIILVSLAKFAIHCVSARICLWHIPGPRSSSILWGEEWLLYHNSPGSLYVAWHKQFGKVVKFTGAFGVSGVFLIYYADV